MRVITIMKYIGALTALTAASAAYAANSGFYVGVDAGRDTGAIKTNESYFSDPINANQTYASHIDGFLWGARAGYNWFLTQQFVLGTEVSWNKSNASLGWQNSASVAVRDLQINSSIGATILPGWQVDNNNRLYARLGWIQSEFDQENNAAVLYGPTFSDLKQNGIQVGLGYLLSLTSQWDMRMEYNHNDYHAIHEYIGTDSYSYKPEFDRYTLGVDYNFDSAQIKFADSVMTSPFSGWYTGVDMGRDQASSNINITTDSSTSQQDRSLRGYLGGVHIGYSWQVMQHALLGIEAFALANSTETSYYSVSSIGSDVSTTDNKIREQNGFGLSLLPGYQLNQSSLLYARIGYIDAKFEKTGTGTDLGPDFSTNKPGLQLGLGYKVAFNNQWSVSGEYDYADYAEIHTSDSTGNFNYDMEDNQYKFGINYHF